MPLTKRDLDQMGCGIAHCTHDHSQIHIHAACHPHSAVDAWYDKTSGCLQFRCKKCQTPVAAVEVAAFPAIATVKQ